MYALPFVLPGIFHILSFCGPTVLHFLIIFDQHPVNIMHDYTNCCLYRFVPPNDELQACSKHEEAYYWNKLIVNSASCSFILYGYITMHGQQNFKKVLYFVRKLKNITSCSKLRNLSLPAYNNKDERLLEVWLLQFDCPSFPSVNTGPKLVISVTRYWNASSLFRSFSLT